MEDTEQRIRTALGKLAGILAPILREKLRRGTFGTAKIELELHLQDGTINHVRTIHEEIGRV